MKITRFRFAFFSVLLLLVFMLAGCGGVNPWEKSRDVFFVQKPGPVVTNNLAVYAPEDVIAPAVTNLESGIIAPAVAKPGATPISYVQIGVQTPGIWEDGPNVENSKAITNVIPVYGGLATLAVTAASAIAKLILNRKRKPIIVSTFQAIEDWANGAIASGDPKAIALATSLKEKLAAAHDYADVMPAVQALLQAYTGSSKDVQAITALAKGQ